MGGKLTSRSAPEHSSKKVYVVEDTYQYDGGSVILGIYDNSNEALIHQQRVRREYRAKYKNTPSAKVDTMLQCVSIREIEMNKDLWDV